MTPEEKQAELKRHRDILFATIDYLLEKTASRIKYDQLDLGAQYYQQLKQKTEKHYQNGRLERLQKKLRDMTEVPRQTGDVSFGGYIKERTGYDIDVFGPIREHVEKIIEEKRIKNKSERRDVGAMANLCQQIAPDQEKLDVLINLLKDFDDRRSKRKSYKKNDLFVKHIFETYSPDRKRKLTITESGTDKKYAVTHVDINFEQAGGIVYGASGVSLDIKAFWKDNNTIVIETKKDYVVVTRKFQQIQSLEDIVKIEYLET